MRKNRNPEKGFTLIELIVVIAVLAILAGVAVPQFINITVQAKEAAEREDVKAVAAGIRLKALSDMVTGGSTSSTLTYPGSLEAGDPIAVFENVVDLQSARSMFDRGWKEPTTGNTYTAPQGTPYAYDSTLGTFLRQ